MNLYTEDEAVASKNGWKRFTYFMVELNDERREEYEHVIYCRSFYQLMKLLNEWNLTDGDCKFFAKADQ
jgi:sarcosine oxidase delta subunit